MAVKISQLSNSSTSLSLTDVFPIVQGGTTKKSTIETLNTHINPENLIPIYAQADLTPYLSGGKYAIPSGKGFLFKRSIQIDKPIQLPANAESCLIGSPNGSSVAITITYTGTTGAMIQGTNISGFTIVDLVIVSGEGTGGLPAQTLFSVSNGSSPANFSKWFFVFRAQFQNWSNLGTVEGSNLVLIDALAILVWGTGILLKNIGLTTLSTITAVYGRNTSGILIKFEEYCDRILFNVGNIILASTEKAIKINSAALVSKALFSLITYNGLGSFFDSSGKTQTDPAVLVRTIPPIPDSVSKAFVTGAGPLTVTNPGVGIYARVNLSYTDRDLERFELIEAVPSSGVFCRLKYLGIESIRANFNIACNVNAVSGSPKGQIALGLNGNALDYTGIENNTPGMGVAKGTLTLQTNDYIELFIKNPTDGTNLIVKNININIGD